MNPDVERRIIDRLKHAPAPCLPLRDLYRQVVAEAGPAAGSYARFAEDLRRSGRFVLLEPESPLGDAQGWPPGVRALYERQLVDAMDARLHIALVAESDPPARARPPGRVAAEEPPPDRDTMVDRLHESIVRLLECAPADPALHSALAHAMTDCEEMRRLLGNP